MEADGGQSAEIHVLQSAADGSAVAGLADADVHALLLEQLENRFAGVKKALDEKNASHFYQLLKKINAEKRITVLMVTHDLKRASSYADDIWVLEDGKVKQEAGKGEGQA